VLKTLPQTSVITTVIGQFVVVVTEGGVNIALVLSEGYAGSPAKVPPQAEYHETVNSLGFDPTGKVKDTGVGVPVTTLAGIPLTSGARLEFLPAIKEKLKKIRCAAILAGSCELLSE
jgi:hypothetical protein